MLGVIAGEFLVQTWIQTGALPEGGSLPDDVQIDAIMLRVLGIAQGLRECDAEASLAADECAYWTNELEHESALDDGILPDASGTEAVCAQAAPAGLVALEVEDAERLAKAVCEGANSGILEDAQALAGAICMACDGADTEKIAAYILSRELPPDSPVLSGTGALLKSESFEETVGKALENGFGTEAALAAAGLAEPIFGVPDELADSIWERLTPDLRTVAEDFQEFMVTRHADR